MKRKTKDVVRFQVEITAEKDAQLRQIMADTDITTKRELFNSVLSLFAWAVRETQSGAVIVSTGSDGSMKELVMPALDAVLTGPRRK